MTNRPNKSFRLFHAGLTCLFLVSLFSIFGTLISSTPDIYRRWQKAMQHEEPFQPIEMNLAQSSSLLKYLETGRAWLRYHVFSLSPNSLFWLGSDGWFVRQRGALLERGKVLHTIRGIDDHLGKVRLSEYQLRTWANVLLERREFLKENGVPYVVAFIPRKTTVYPEIYPAQVRKHFGETRQDQLVRYLQENTDLHVINLKEPLLTVRREEGDEKPLFLKTDGHWNMYGAYRAYEEVMREVNGVFPDIELSPVPLSELQYREKQNWCHRGFSRQVGICIREPYPYFLPVLGSVYSHIPVFRPRDGRRIYQPSRKEWNGGIKRSPGLLFTTGIGRTGYPLAVVKNSRKREKEYKLIRNYGSPELRSILVASASFGEKMLYFLAAHTQKLYHYRELDSFDEHLVLARTDLDLVLQTFPEGALRSPPTNPENIRIRGG